MMTYRYRSEAVDSIWETDEDSIRHDVLHPADHLHPHLELREVLRDSAVLKISLQVRFLGENLNTTRLRSLTKCLILLGKLAPFIHTDFMKGIMCEHALLENTDKFVPPIFRKAKL